MAVGRLVLFGLVCNGVSKTDIATGYASAKENINIVNVKMGENKTSKSKGPS